MALTWVRTFLTSPDGVPVEIDEEFELTFTPEERVHVIAAMKGMYCVNLAVNTNRYLVGKLNRRSGVESPGVCRIAPPA